MTSALEGLARARTVWDFTTGSGRRYRDRTNIIPCAMIEGNVFLTSIALQNKGYALMQVD